ncbi:MAG: CvpA family protein [Dehalococcoidia bacterium]
MNWVSFVLLGVIALLTWRAWRNGVIRELVSLGSVILAIPMAGIFYDDMFPKIHPIVDSVPLANLVAFLAIFLGVVIGGQVIATLLRSVVAALNLGLADQAAGAVFGFLKGVLLCQAILIALVAFPKPDIREDIDQSTAAQGLLDTAPAVLAILPTTFDHAIDAFMGGAHTLDGIIGPSPTPAATPTR